ncbi:type II toxin-antitoxin system VapC family toxin [Candidatus Fermentibacteria bacterium]|nr:type II toxin-antitoxin system VapC family toxin [Candidatus Fermentibacteria bacterium]
MGVLIDSSVLIHFERSRTDVSEYVHGHEEEDVFLSVITASELLHGVCRAADRKVRATRLAFVEAALAAFPILPIDLRTARSHAQLWADLAREGQMIGIHDSWLAATCLAHGLRLATSNLREFARVPGLDVEQWT